MSNQDIAFSTLRKKFAVAGASLLSGALLIGGVLIAPTAAGAASNGIPAAQQKLKALEGAPDQDSGDHADPGQDPDRQDHRLDRLRRARLHRADQAR